MIELKIDNKSIKVEKGTSLLQAAKKLEIEIPTMCYLDDGYSNHPSCMVCVVKDKRNGKLHPSCAMPAENGMEIITDDDEVKEARREAIELLLSDHVGDCEAPCRLSCPAFMDIPVMNRLIAKGEFNEALKVVKEEIALPLILGYVCSAPCEGACRRKVIDGAVSICILKRFVADDDLNTEVYKPEKKKNTGKKVTIIGAGPAGLASAFYILKDGHSVTVIDEKEEAGGSLLAIVETELPKTALTKEIDYLKQYGVNFELGKKVNAQDFESLKKDYDAVLIASGDLEGSNISEFGLESGKAGLNTSDGTFETNQEGVFACGSVLKHHKMAIRALAQGRAAAYSVNSFLQGNGAAKTERMFNSRFGKLQENEFDAYKVEATDASRIEPAEGKLKGYTKEEAIKEAQRCLRCDCRKPTSCKLRIYADEYGANQKKYSIGERKKITKSFQHDEIVYESEKCIRCGLCIDIASKEKELTGLTYIGRGFDVKVDIPFNKSLGEALTKAAKKCVESCPTGALAFKNGEK